MVNLLDTNWVRWPSENDFGCGFQDPLSLGTRSSNLRVVAISWSNSGNSASAWVIGFLWREKGLRKRSDLTAQEQDSAIYVVGGGADLKPVNQDGCSHSGLIAQNFAERHRDAAAAR